MKDDGRRTELGQFLRMRRERLNPSEYGFEIGRRRRTPGLRREELAHIAGVSVSWYTWLEQGRKINVSPQVLDSVARALQLNAAERRHLFYLVFDAAEYSAAAAEPAVDYKLQAILDSWAELPAFAIDEQWDIVAWNEAACRVFTIDFALLAGRERNLLWMNFMNPVMRRLFVNWEKDAQSILALYRSGRLLQDETMAQELYERCSEFRQWWELQDIQVTYGSDKLIDHPVVGRMSVRPVTLTASEYPMLRIVLHIPAAQGDARERLRQLASP
ncbi:helix-turn-helix transcriptional regulator [Paenibacillus xylaniclasticus]|uniref:helix-turn-helix transcriptional regulator n=1 Tax=Paenibacillus xylaniclasticus TaxID=588083 RepID=UPI000FD97DC2|nr:MULTISPECIES: helix-turn-helix transcriptional regulator [Paenibacillus]GFN32879.1 transcriptional regulator [Paenibacillus curdlanolyticus]